MRLTIITLATIALVSCNQAEAPADTNAAEANVEADANVVAADENAAVAAAARASRYWNRSTPAAITSPYRVKSISITVLP
jgi:hypothetical protein